MKYCRCHFSEGKRRSAHRTTQSRPLKRHNNGSCREFLESEKTDMHVLDSLFLHKHMDFILLRFVI